MGLLPVFIAVLFTFMYLVDAFIQRLKLHPWNQTLEICAANNALLTELQKLLLN